MARPDWALEESLITLMDNQHFQRLIELMEEDRKVWKERFAEGALLSHNELDQRELDRKHGYFDGARYYLIERMNLSRTRLSRRAQEGVEA